MFLRGASLINTLQDWMMEGEGRNGIVSLGNSWLSNDAKTSYSYADKIDKSFHNSAVLVVDFV